jgi:flagellar biosynthesis regulator FlaF
VFGEVAEE